MSSPDFDDFYAGSYRRMVGYLYTVVGNLGEAEDAVQEAYCRAWRQWRRLETYADPEAWVRTVAYRVAVSSWRKATNRLRAHRRHGVTEDAPGLEPDHVALVAGLRKLTVEQRRVIVLHHLIGLPLEDIARETDVAVGTVKSRLARGRQALAAEFIDSTAGAGSRTRRVVHDA